MPFRIGEFHSGEIEIHNLLKVPPLENPTSPGLPFPYHRRILNSPLLALGTLDSRLRPWTTVWGGQRGFANVIAPDILGVSSEVSKFDPVYQALWDGGEKDRAMSGLAIDLENRDRVKIMGRMVAGAVDGQRVQMAMLVTESLGNCPKYLNKKTISPHDVKKAELLRKDFPLCNKAVELLGRADLFFLSSTNGESMDTNHRGGKPGFVRILKNNEDELVLVYPEYSGNRLYQTLGNIKVNALVGVVVPDFETGNALHLTGSASILVGEDASSTMLRTNIAVKLTVSAARFIYSTLPFVGTSIDLSPYNPPISNLTTEHATPIGEPSTIFAYLKDRETLTPSISRFTFELSGQAAWKPGQHITLDFGPELENGYAHMNDSDPQSLNDDYVRTFTVSSVPRDKKVQITARKHGPATALMWRQNLKVPLELQVLGFGGKESFRMKGGVFIAGGIGITPLLAQAGDILVSKGELFLLWSLRGEDLNLALDSFRRIKGLARVSRLFVTGDPAGRIDEVIEIGAKVEIRSIRQGDIEELKMKGRKFYLCASPGLLGELNRWLDGEEVAWEDFGY